MRYRLFEEYAHRYDLHTPAHHYRHDHAFVLNRLIDAGTGARRILDVGCGTGVFLVKALATGFDATGIDPASGMVEQAATKVGAARVRQAAMEDIDMVECFDGICALSWVINYASTPDSALEILARMHEALAPGGRLILQCAHAPNMVGKVFEDREPGPDGNPDDVIFLFQFASSGPESALARYVFAGKTMGELVWEEHPLSVADANLVASLARQAGFLGVTVFDSWRGDPLDSGISAWIVAERGA